MKAIKYDLLGKFAHFKNPEINVKFEPTFEHITKTVLLGQLGCVLGLRGLQQQKELGYVEYVEELKDIKVSIVPHAARWGKCVDNMNNSTGYANKDGATQIVNRQLLENVRWTIYILKDSIKKNHYNKLLEMLRAGKTTYPLFLGKTECKARIENIEEVELGNIEIGEFEKCDSLILEKNIMEIESDVNEDFNFEDELFIGRYYFPIKYNEVMLYELEKIIFTNSFINICEGEFYGDNEKILNFF